ncbi:linoleate 9S-lipoxygenase 6-like [Miscanthus floridulus]|uniref:linoleate 9S-lipoxygenase 6-like n=1 Tax=Miscanthus floridulus TaxID=154761 RepID=UPI003457CEE2
MQMPFCWDRRSPAHAPENHIAINGTVVVSCHLGLSSPGKTTTLRLFSSTQMDPNTGKGKLSAEAPLKGGKKTKAKQGAVKTSTMTYQVTFFVDAEFGTPGAVVVKNGMRNDQFFLRHVHLDMPEAGRSIHFDCNSWVYPYKKTNADRVFFINTSYLPDKTPGALRLLRDEELRSLRGSGRGERKDWERVYDYDYYNDLGNPDKEDHARPVLGGSTSMYPYPRRCRTGRPLFKTDGVTETRKHMINLDFYIPPDERFSPTKLAEVLTLAVQAVTHFVLPESKALFHGNINSFRSFEQLKGDLYRKPQQPVVDGQVMDKLKTSVPSHKTYKQVSKMVKETPVNFPIPQVIEHEPEAWRSDEEFAREMLAGLNPVVIKRLEVFPPVSRGGKESSITAAHIQRQLELEGRTVQKALEEKRLYILDHHDYLMPYLRRINTQQGVCVYASRTLLFLKDDGTLKPLVIELSLPSDGAGDGEISRVFLPASQGANGHLWWLAKAHVSVNDSGYHQLISHWLFTHATVEPFIIATKRQLSAMHPIHKLLEPHFKDNMQINTLARSILLSAGGILERTMFPGKYAMEMSSAIYSEWRFTDQSLPNELVKRGMASKDPRTTDLHLHVEDYPYAVDGMDVWRAIDGWVRSYCAHFYHSDAAVATDAELQAWWHDVRTVGHGDRQLDPACWLELDTVANLAESLSTLIWIASALHAAVNFGQYGYAGFMPNRPTRCRRFVPLPGSPEMAQLQADPDRFFLDTVPDRFTTTLGLTLIEVLSTHTSDELYLGQRATAGWTDDGEVLQLLDRFRDELRRVEKRVTERNGDLRLKNRKGPAKVPYTLLFPDVGNVGGKEKGITGKGIPNSVSI